MVRSSNGAIDAAGADACYIARSPQLRIPHPEQKCLWPPRVLLEQDRSFLLREHQGMMPNTAYHVPIAAAQS
jgi:hypothetical protein